MSEWISVKDRLPEIGKTCLLYITWPKDTRFHTIAFPLNRTNIRLGGLRWNDKFTTVEYQSDYSDRKEMDYVTHWMPLPQPPEVKDE